MNKGGRPSEIEVYSGVLLLWRGKGNTYPEILDKLEKKSGRRFHLETLKRFFRKFRSELELSIQLEHGKELVEKNRKGLTSLHKLDKLIEKYEKKIEELWEKLQPKSLEGVINSYSKLIDIRSKITGEQKTAGNINISFGNDVHAKAFSKYTRRYVESKGDSFEKFLISFHHYLKDEHSDITGLDDEEDNEGEVIDIELNTP